MKKIVVMLICTFAILGLAGCPQEPPPQDIAVTGVTLEPAEVQLEYLTALPAAAEESDTEQLTAAVSPEDATNTAITWSSADAAIVTVSTDGLVTAVAPGSASVTVETEDGGFTAVSEVTIQSRMDVSGPVAKEYAIATGTLSTYTHPSPRNYLLVDEKDHSVVLVTDDSDDDELAFTTYHPSADQLYTTAEYNGDLTYSDDTVSLFSALIIPSNGGANDAVVYGDLSLSPREYYTYMFATGEVTISGTDTSMGTITWSNVECGYGWNILKVENDFVGNTTIKNGSIAAPEWTMLAAP